MSLDAIKQVTETEENARQAKAAAEAAAKKQIAQAQQNGQAAVEAARSDAESVVKDWMAQAESKAATEAKQNLAEAEQACGLLQKNASARLDDAVAWIVRRVVNV